MTRTDLESAIAEARRQVNEADAAHDAALALENHYRHALRDAILRLEDLESALKKIDGGAGD